MSNSTGIYRADEILYDALKDVGFNSITFGSFNEVNLNKQNIFPLAHLVLVSSARTVTTQSVSYQVLVMDMVDSNDLDPRQSKNNFRLTTNFEDVWSDLDNRLGEMQQKFARRQDLVTLDDFTANALKDQEQNVLSGWELSLTITIPAIGLC